MTTQALVVVLGLSHCGYAHYSFSQFVVNGSETPDWYYVRDVLGDPRYNDVPWDLAKMSPFYDIYSDTMICGRDSGAGPNTHTAIVLAGDEVGFKVYNWTIGSAIFHPGPGQVYLSKAPNNNVEYYDGKGDWFKIATAGAKNDTAWKLLWEKEMRFTIPVTTPPGKYLLRIEHFQPHPTLNKTQWYVNCAQINVVGLGGGTPTGLVKFPGAYDILDPGIMMPPGTSNYEGLLKYVAPGPPVWTG